MTSAFVLHDLGAADAGRPWREVVPNGWEVPDLPGHGNAAAPRHGAYDPVGPVTLARWALAGQGLVVGVGQNAHGALILAAGGACDAVAIVDGLWGQWSSADDSVEQMYATIRRLLDDDGAVGRPPSTGLDPRTRHGYGVTVSASFAEKFWGAITCPVLAIETPASPTPPTERAERLSWFGAATTLIELDSNEPVEVIGAISGWWGWTTGGQR